MGGNDTTVRWNTVNRAQQRRQDQWPLTLRGWLLNRRRAEPGMTQPLSARALRRQMARDRKRRQAEIGIVKGAPDA